MAFGAVGFIVGGMRYSHLSPWKIEWTSPWKRLIPRIGATSSSMNLRHLLRTHPVLFAVWVSALCFVLDILVIRHLHSEEHPNTCSSCGYSLFGNLSGRCPECGTLIKSARCWAAGSRFFVYKLRTRTSVASIVLLSMIILSPWPVRSIILDGVLGTNIRERDRVLVQSSREIESALQENVPNYERARLAFQKALGIAGPCGETFRFSGMIDRHMERDQLIVNADSALSDGDYATAEKLYESAIVMESTKSLEERLRQARARRLINEAHSAKAGGDFAVCKSLIEQSLWWMPTPEAEELLGQLSSSNLTTRPAVLDE